MLIEIFASANASCATRSIRHHIHPKKRGHHEINRTRGEILEITSPAKTADTLNKQVGRGALELCRLLLAFSRLDHYVVRREKWLFISSFLSLFCPKKNDGILFYEFGFIPVSIPIVGMQVICTIP